MLDRNLLFSNTANNSWKSDPERIDPDVYQYGTRLLHFNFSFLGQKEIETWVQNVSKRSGQKVDWSTWGASLDDDDLTASIKGLGDLEKIRTTMIEMLPELNKACNEYNNKKWNTNSYQKTWFTEKDFESLENKSAKSFMV